MYRVKCIVGYDGSKFHGFQIQDNVRTVQGEIEKALKNITQQDIIIHASGRTDAKVHALGQVFHFDTGKEMTENRWRMAINHFMPEDIYIYDCCLVDAKFHSRYSATTKEYRYYLSMNDYDPIQVNYVFQYGRTLDVHSVREASEIFLGTKNFASFCAKDPYGNTQRTIFSFDILEENGIVEFRIVGNGFRRYMVRHIIGALIQVGARKITKETVLEMLKSEGNKKCTYKAKPQGLYLYQVNYGGSDNAD